MHHDKTAADKQKCSCIRQWYNNVFNSFLKLNNDIDMSSVVAEGSR